MISFVNNIYLDMISYFEGDPQRIQHFVKVYSFAKLIGEAEKLPSEKQEVLEIAALLHDIGIKVSEIKHGYNNGKLQEEYGPIEAMKILNKYSISSDNKEEICYLIGHHHSYQEIQSKELQILIEADFLVNIYEDQMDILAIKNIYERIFKTASGKEICSQMYNLNEKE